MKTCWPQTSLSFGARMRATMSVPPPAGNATTMRTGFVGNAWVSASASVVGTTASVARTPSAKDRLRAFPGESSSIERLARNSKLFHAGACGFLLERLDLACTVRDASSAPRLFLPSLRFPGNQDLVEALRLPAGAHA